MILSRQLSNSAAVFGAGFEQHSSSSNRNSTSAFKAAVEAMVAQSIATTHMTIPCSGAALEPFQSRFSYCLQLRHSQHHSSRAEPSSEEEAELL